MRLNRPIRVVSLVVLASVALTAQVVRQGNVVPLKNWAAPLYWQPNQAERAAPGGATPQLQFSANAVSTNALTFVAITPCRLVDTRGAAGGFNGIAPFSGPSIAAAGTLTIPVQSTSEASTNTEPAPCGVIPSIAQGYSLNLTVVPHAGGAVDYISLWPSGAAQPFVATLDDPQGAIVSNAAIVPAGTPTGGISVYNAGPATTDVIIDMNGYFAAPTDVNANTAIGAGTLASNTTGSVNTAVGEKALQDNTIGCCNTASGYSALQENTSGSDNTAIGVSALQNNTTGNYNTASGVGALGLNTTGGNNTASGYGALDSNTTGSDNTASGFEALFVNTTGADNTAAGYNALHGNTTGTDNTATGYNALLSNTTGIDNTASGYEALQSNTTGGTNSAFGLSALQFNTTGNYNTASGVGTLLSNTTGGFNTASGANAMLENTTGGSNTAAGFQSLLSNTAGSNDIAVGYQAGANISGSNNIDVGNPGAAGDGSAANSGVIRIGTPGTQTSAFIAGIWNNTPNATNSLVCIDAIGTLGTTGCTSTPSSRRFKEQISDMGDSSSKLLQLRPVTFLYKPQYDDGSHALQYGLIAEEVAKLYPEMVGYDKDGQPSSVKYQSLAPMLLNEVQKQNAQIQLVLEQNRKLEDRLAALEVLLSPK